MKKMKQLFQAINKEKYKIYKIQPDFKVLYLQ